MNRVNIMISPQSIAVLMQKHRDSVQHSTRHQPLLQNVKYKYKYIQTARSHYWTALLTYAMH